MPRGNLDIPSTKQVSLTMADTKQPQKPGPGSGYREQQDPRGQPGQHQTKDGKQLPEEADPDEPKPREP